jgi:hypothetical protein
VELPAVAASASIFTRRSLNGFFDPLMQEMDIILK